ncbi:MAG: hypothetical protein K9H61_13810 [Bacteroidia bacterium]|nr:hypothetical protein [Bacteroidia bacterium]MCF8427981.1 hypothetical protein [Bacteroidia bacterium]MCF8448061.1 hypothetical protein [Bacteroidia bacterium]
MKEDYLGSLGKVFSLINTNGFQTTFPTTYYFMIYFWLALLIIIGILFGVFYRNKFYDLNRRLFDYLEHSNFETRLNTIESTFTLTGAWSWQHFKLYSDGKCIILMDSYDMDLNSNSKLYAKTYLITRKEELKNYPVDLFKNILIIKELELAPNDLLISGEMKYQLILKRTTWVKQSDNIKIKIKKPNNGFDFRKIINFNSDN